MTNLSGEALDAEIARLRKELIPPVPQSVVIGRARDRIEELERALRAIKDDPYGCPFCDSGKLRKPNDPNKGHNDDCGYLLLDAALAGAKP